MAASSNISARGRPSLLVGRRPSGILDTMMHNDLASIAKRWLVAAVVVVNARLGYITCLRLRR